MSDHRNKTHLTNALKLRTSLIQTTSYYTQSITRSSAASAVAEGPRDVHVIVKFSYVVTEYVSPSNINVIYASLKSTSSGLQFLSLTVHVYLHSICRCCLSNLPNHAKFRELIAVQGHPRSSTLVPIESA